MNDREFEILKKNILQIKPEKSDVIVWLQGDLFDRGYKVLELFHSGFANKIIITGNNNAEQLHPGEKHLTPGEMREWLVSENVNLQSITIDETAVNTRSQAENVIELALKNNWSKLLIVCSAHFQPRTLLTFLKRANETGWQGKIICQDVVMPDDQVPGGKLKTVAELVNEEKIKIEKYVAHVATIQEGLKYLNSL